MSTQTELFDEQPDPSYDILTELDNELKISADKRKQERNIKTRMHKFITSVGNTPNRIISVIHTLITDCKECMSPWYPVQLDCAPYSNSLNFTEYSGKRFIPRWKKLLNKIMPYIYNYGNKELCYRYNRQSDNYVLMFTDKHICLLMHAGKYTIELTFPLQYNWQRLRKIEDMITCVVETIDKTPETCSPLRDIEGKRYRAIHTYSIEDSRIFTSVSCGCHPT